MSAYRKRIADLAARSRADRDALDPGEAGPERARAYLREGVGEVLSLYVEVRTGGDALEPDEHEDLRRALNDWLDCYAACHGVSLGAEFAVREAAELLVATHDLRDAAQLLTGVPERDPRRAWADE